MSDGDWIESKDQDPLGDVRLIQLADIGDGVYLDRSNRFLTNAKAQELQCTFLEPSDVLIARMPDPLGRACMFPGDTKRSVTAVDVCIFRSGSLGVDQGWLMHMVNSPAVRSEIVSFATGTTRRRISGKNLKSIRVPVAPLNEQRRIADKIDELFSDIEQGEEALRRAKTLLQRYRQAVLKAAVTGELTRDWRAQHEGEVESGEQLLARIFETRRAAWEKAVLAKMAAKGQRAKDDSWKRR